MKKFLITTMLGIATTAAFGAASLRAPQMGGTVTVATPTATNTARAGTMRTQTMKTSSVSTPSVTTAQSSIATPVSTETTDARIALLKGIKGFNPGKIKDTTAATNELNSLNDRIEELTAQLDRAEAAQSSVITEANIDAKITEKLTALGTTPVATDTYSKAEVDSLLNDIKRKLPQIDDRGNINMTDPNGTLISIPAYWYEYTMHNTETHRADIYRYSGHKTEETINNWINDICNETATDNRIACCRRGEVAEQHFGINSFFHGYAIWWSQIENHNNQLVLRQFVNTTEDDPATYVHDQICGANRPADECWVTIDSSAPVCGGATYYTTVNVYTPVGQPYYDLIDTVSNHGIVTRYVFKTNTTEEEIYEFVDNWCNGASAWCHTGYIDTNNPNYPNETLFTIAKRTVGHYIHQQNFVNYGGHMGFDITYHINVHDSVYNNDPVAYIQQEICNNNVGACYVTWVNDNYELYGLDTMNSNLYTFYDVGVFKEMLTKEELPAEYKPKQQTPDE